MHHPEVADGIALPTLREAVEREFPGADVTVAHGTGVDDGDTAGIDEAVRVAREADVVIAVLGDRAGLFGRGTSGGADASRWRCPEPSSNCSTRSWTRAPRW